VVRNSFLGSGVFEVPHFFFFLAHPTRYPLPERFDPFLLNESCSPPRRCPFPPRMKVRLVSLLFFGRRFFFPPELFDCSKVISPFFFFLGRGCFPFFWLRIGPDDFSPFFPPLRPLSPSAKFHHPVLRHVRRFSFSQLSPAPP